MWPQIINIVIGLWLMVSPNILKMTATTSDNNYVIGPLVIAFTIISLWPINRNLVKINVLFGAWLLIALFVLYYFKTIAFFSNGACGVVIILFSVVKRKANETFGGGWRSLFQRNPLHMQESDKIENQRR